MKRLTFLQGSPEWHAHRATARNASEAPAVLGCSPYMTRAELLRVRHTGIQAEVPAELERIFAAGHAIEAAQREGAAELVGEPLYPVVGSAMVDGIELSASFDGLTMAEDVAYECKTLNDDLRAALPYSGEGSDCPNDSHSLPKHYRVQMEQQLAVCGGERVLFVAATKDGSDVRRCWYYPDPKLRVEIIAGWDQFDRDLTDYVPAEVKEMPKAEVTLALPALFIHAKGEITTSNMKEYGEALAKRLAEVRSIALVTDQDFSNAKESAKLLRENIQQAKLAKDAMLAQTVSVGEAARMIDTWCEDMRLTALKLEQDVEREDKAKKAAMLAKAKADYEAHIEALKVDTGGPWILLAAPNWPEAIKSKRSFASMQDALDTMLANAKIVADESARKIRAALAALDDEAKGCEHLFADRLSFISKPADDVRALVKGRIAEHRAAEERRAAELAERERARFRAEEEARARATAAREQQEREAAEAQRRKDEAYLAGADDRERARQAEIAGAVLESRGVIPAPAAGPAVIPMPTRAPAAPAGAPTLKLGEIQKRLAPLSIDAAGLAALGFPVVKQEGAAKLWHESSWHGICAAIAQHVAAVANGQKAAA